MERKLEESLKNWEERATRHPLILRGARQVGKTYLVREFARKCFKHFIEVNFEEDASFVKFFESKNPNIICELLNSRFSVPVKDGETLSFPSHGAGGARRHKNTKEKSSMAESDGGE